MILLSLSGEDTPCAMTHRRVIVVAMQLSADDNEEAYTLACTPEGAAFERQGVCRGGGTPLLLLCSPVLQGCADVLSAAHVAPLEGQGLPPQSHSACNIVQVSTFSAAIREQVAVFKAVAEVPYST